MTSRRMNRLYILRNEELGRATSRRTGPGKLRYHSNALGEHAIQEFCPCLEVDDSSTQPLRHPMLSTLVILRNVEFNQLGHGRNSSSLAGRVACNPTLDLDPPMDSEPFVPLNCKSCAKTVARLWIFLRY